KEEGEEEDDQHEEQAREEGKEEGARPGKRKFASMAKALCRYSAWRASSRQPNDAETGPPKHQRKASAPGTMGSGTAATHETVS
ncbi:unnamed protein product, partial [Ectocarpus sp. 13 AM-2016]